MSITTLRTAKFEPLADITALEVAMIFARYIAPAGGCLQFSGITFVEADWAELPPEVRRHFKVEGEL